MTEKCQSLQENNISFSTPYNLLINLLEFKILKLYTVQFPCLETGGGQELGEDKKKGRRHRV